ncbi:MAG TPA: PEP/pyruvate-binding domain-containing protein [Acidimicrobiales bacterium]|nr:PEP/pyruvate-binding domain-containing protein [Acidimicrobiales bacterium]
MSTSTSPGTVPPPVLGLDNQISSDPSVVGAKAAALAVARRAGLPVLDGFVIPVGGAADVAGVSASRLPDGTADALRTAWRRLAPAGQPVVVRSSSPHEDTTTSSMAGQFRSVLDVRDWPGLVAAVGEVVASAGGGPMAVLVQPFVRPRLGGVLFGADPVTGRTDRLVVSAVPGGPDRLVSGEVDGTQLTLSPGGRLVDGAPAPGAGDVAARTLRRRLARLARDTARTFDGPQDIEWAVLEDGQLLLLQSRPITTLGEEARPAGPILGPGPVAETFPAPLAPLEEDLWIPPLREGLHRALALTGAVSRRQLRESPVIVTVRGRVAADLDLLGLAPRRRSWWRKLDPRGPARRLGAAWGVGRLRAALPGLATDALATVDAHLAEVPAVDTLSAGQLVRLLDRAGDELSALHGYEVLAGQLLGPGTDSPTAASVALRTLSDARASEPHTPDDELVARHPVLLALVPPAITPERSLPPAPALLARHGSDGPRPGSRFPAPSEPGAGLDPGVVREALRLRARWVHELMARAALAVGDELVRRAVLADAGEVRSLRMADLREIVVRRAAAEPVPSVVRPARLPSGGPAPLPAAFRLAGDDVIVPVAQPSGRTGHGAGGGRGSGPVHNHPATGDGAGPAEVPDGAVLVVPTLDPALAPLLPRLGGLVAETGSVLSHLAILAREYGVPTVVALPGATDRFTDGSWVVVDGTTGEVEAAGDEEWRAA